MQRKLVVFNIILGLLVVSSFNISPALAAPPQARLRQGGIAWFDPGWSYRRTVLISNPCGMVVNNYQVQVTLDSSFNFSHALADGSDLRITAGDGTTQIPFWIESWNPGSSQASIWVKVPEVLITGATIYIYYGNPSPPAPALQEMPPAGPWTRAAANPVVPLGGGPGNGWGLLAENIVYDPDTAHYWMVHANYNDGGVGLLWSDTPADAASWHWQGTVVNYANAPHILHYNNTWYIFYADRGHGADPYPISVSTAAEVTGPYTYQGAMLTSDQAWEAFRVDEPFVFRREDGKWIMMYMADSGGNVEQVGYATADNLLGPYTKYAGNPVLAFGPPGSYDAGTIADPWVYYYHGVYYIGYTVSSTTNSPWQTAYATTTDWVTFTKHGITLPLGPPSAWDETNAFRGAVLRVGDTYVFAYTGDNYQIGIATQPVFMLPPAVNLPANVFDFYDDFNDGVLDGSKWRIETGETSQIAESGGHLTLTGNPGESFIKVNTIPVFNMNFLVETRLRHPQAGTLNQIVEAGMTWNLFYNSVRIADDFHGTTYWERQSITDSTPGDPWTFMAQPVDTGWHVLKVSRNSPNIAGFQIDSTTQETTTVNVPTIPMSPFLMSYGGGNTLISDWLRVRKWCGAELPAPVGTETPRPLSGRINVTKTGPAQVLSGDTASFTITVSNNGDYDLTDISLTDSQTPTCNNSWASLAIGQSQTYSCSHSNLTQDLLNSATAVAMSPSGQVSYTGTAFVDVIHPGVSITLDPASQAVIDGHSATFSVLVSNSGDVALQSVTVTDLLAPDCSRSIGYLPAGHTSSYTCSLASVSSGFTNSATVTGQAPLGVNPNATGSSSVTLVSLPNIPWMDPSWHYRRAIILANTCGQVLSDYQVQVVLDGGFDFSKALPDGSDLRVTTIDGVTQIPFWIEQWDPASHQASLWVKLPAAPLNDTAVFVYYGNSSPPGPPLVEVPPVGPWTRAAANPILPTGDPPQDQSLLAENIVYDNVTGHYWMVHANYLDNGVGLVWSDTPADPASWHWQGTVISNANAPHLLKHNGAWYIFFSDWSTDPGTTQHSIQVMQAASVTGPYTNRTTVLSPATGTWENWRVDEPYVFQRDDGKWIMLYMGDSGDYSNGQYYMEQVGYATADNLLGPYTKYAGNPVLPWGPPGSFDAGTVADPWVVEFHGTYYIGYTASPSTLSPWQTAYATTTDWTTFTKRDLTLTLGPPGEWDSSNSFRGAVTRVGSSYVFAYTGDGYQMGIATQPISMTIPYNDPTRVFRFYDGFDGTSLDSNRWSVYLESASNGSVDVAGGLLTLTARYRSGYAYDLIELLGTRPSSPGVLMEASARHPQANGSGATAAELGFGDTYRRNMVRILDYNNPSFLMNATDDGMGGDLLTPMARPLDASNFLLHRVYWGADGQAHFSLANDPWETLTGTVPGVYLPPWLMAYAAAGSASLQVDWIRVRNYCGADLGTQLGAEQGAPANFTGFIDLEGRGNDSGALLTVFNQQLRSGSLAYASGLSSSGGSYTTSFINPYLLGLGSTYWLQVDAPLFLPTTPLLSSPLTPALPTDWQDGALVGSNPLQSLNPLLLLGGDAMNDNLIDILDAACIAGSYNQPPSPCGSGGSSDVNGDGIIDLLDLALMGGNYDRNSSPWSQAPP